MDNLLTVVTSTYNKGERNRASIRSILNQSYKDFKYIVINDGSPDNTKDILNEFDDPRLEIIHQENKGFTETMALVMKRIETPYVAIQGAGDISLGNRLEEQIRFLESRPDVGVVSSVVRQISSVKLDPDKDIKVSSRKYKNDKVEYNKVEQMIKANIINHGEAMIRMTAYNKAGGYRTFFRYAQDRDLWLRILENYSAVRLNQELYLKVIDSEFDIFGNPHKIEKQVLYSLFARRLAEERVFLSKKISCEELEKSYASFVESLSDSEKNQVLQRIFSRISADFTVSESQVDEAISIMYSYFPTHPLIKSLESIKFARTKIPYGNEFLYQYKQINEKYRQFKKSVKAAILR